MVAVGSADRKLRSLTRLERRECDAMTLNILKIDHIGVRVREKVRSIEFYEGLGFRLIVDTGF